MMDNFDDFATKAGLSETQKLAVMNYIMEMLVDNLRSMKDEYNGEIDQAINGIMSGLKNSK
jgi:hypothetical protein